MRLRDRLADLYPAVDLDDDGISAVVREVRGWLEDLAVEQDRKNRKGSTIRNIVLLVRAEEAPPM
jgi:hypothetical protein